jgi:hypothetical protein
MTISRTRRKPKRLVHLSVAYMHIDDLVLTSASRHPGFALGFLLDQRC